jgi:hypothetical protein
MFSHQFKPIRFIATLIARWPFRHIVLVIVETKILAQCPAI